MPEGRQEMEFPGSDHQVPLGLHAVRVRAESPAARWVALASSSLAQGSMRPPAYSPFDEVGTTLTINSAAV